MQVGVDITHHPQGFGGRSGQCHHASGDRRAMASRQERRRFFHSECGANAMSYTSTAVILFAVTARSATSSSLPYRVSMRAVLQEESFFKPEGLVRNDLSLALVRGDELLARGI
jgi:hypothetical protein